MQTQHESTQQPLLSRFAALSAIMISIRQGGLQLLEKVGLTRCVSEVGWLCSQP